MSEQQSLIAAIKVISTKYLPTVVRKHDDAGILKWSLRLADYASRLAVVVSPPLAAREMVALSGPPIYDHVLTYDEETVIFLDAEDKALAALGRPYGRDGAERGALPLFTHIQMAEDLNLPLHVAEFRSFVVSGAAQ
jgi:hypothetical protein